MVDDNVEVRGWSEKNHRRRLAGHVAFECGQWQVYDNETLAGYNSRKREKRSTRKRREKAEGKEREKDLF